MRYGRKKYILSPEVKKFIKENQDLIDANKWEEVLLKAANTKGLLIAELIYIFVSCEIEGTKDKQMTIGLSGELNRIIKNNEVLDDMLKKIK